MSDIRRIARLAGVSPATVSRTMNGHPHVREALRQHILGIARRENYKPQRPAPGHLAARSDVIGYLQFGVPGLKDGRMAEAAETVLFDAGYKTFVCNADGDRARVRFYLDSMIKRGVAGCILAPQGYPTRALAAAHELEAAGIVPIVLDALVQVPDVSAVAVDPLQCWHFGMDYLTGLGHQRVLALVGPAERSWLEEAGDGVLPDAEATDPFDAAGLLDAHLDQPSSTWPTAIFCSNEQIACTVLRVLRQRRIAVPGALSVLSLGGTDFARMVSPRITSVAIPFSELGGICAQQLLALVQDGASSPRTVILRCRLAEGDTTAAISTS